MNTAIATQNGVDVAPPYRVFKNGRKIPKKVFATYDAARSWVRRKVRSLREEPGVFPAPAVGELAIWIDPNDYDHRTPSLSSHGYSIKRVEV